MMIDGISYSGGPASPKPDEVATACASGEPEFGARSSTPLPGQLPVTTRLPGEAQASIPTLLPRVGFVALQTDTADRISDTLETEIRQAENTFALRDRIQEVLAPYSTVFDDVVPPVSENKRSFMQRLRDQPLSDIPVTSRFRKDRTYRGLEARYNFQFTLLPNDYRNVVQEAVMDIMDQTGKQDVEDLNMPGLRFAYAYSDGTLSSIELRSRPFGKHEYNLHASDQLFETVFNMRKDPNPLGTFITLTANSGAVSKLAIDFQSERPSIQVGPRDKYVFDPVTNEFMLFGSQGMTWSYQYTQEGGSFIDARRPAKLSCEEFLAVTDGAMRMIPGVEF